MTQWKQFWKNVALSSILIGVRAPSDLGRIALRLA